MFSSPFLTSLLSSFHFLIYFRTLISLSDALRRFVSQNDTLMATYLPSSFLAEYTIPKPPESIDFVFLKPLMVNKLQIATDMVF